MKFDIFVLPFTIGFYFLLAFFVFKVINWIVKLPGEDKKKIFKNLSFRNIFVSLKEIFSESLLHRKIFKVNPVLGYMHMSFAFGWFLLILVGNVEAYIYTKGDLKPIYHTIFFRFFEHDLSSFRYEKIFSFFMDFLLMFIIVGLLLALTKRFYSRIFGMKKTSSLKVFDRLALASLWLIFPFRLLAESSSAGIYGGGNFLTAGLGGLMSGFPYINELSYTSWWAYSVALGVFFISLPKSRYMHIPTEIVLIFLRNLGLAQNKEYTSYSDIQVNSCSRCGICLDPCQMGFVLNQYTSQPSYLTRDIRQNCLDDKNLFDCLMCGRCDNICPVGIDSVNIKKAKRNECAKNFVSNYSYLPDIKVKKADVIWFAGCMTHLTPSIIYSMKKVFATAEIDYCFMDEDGTICCGRPLMLAGQDKQARELMDKNKRMINSSGARTLVTSCPICLKVFKEDYNLDVEVLHHSQYLLRLIDSNKILLKRQDKKVVYHDPCELGRGSGIYNEPRIVINKVAILENTGYDKENALCCGGSLGNLEISTKHRNQIINDTVTKLTGNNPDKIITSCPLCKKTLQKSNSVVIEDIVQLVARSLIRKSTFVEEKVREVEETLISSY